MRPYSISLRRPTDGLCGENGKLFLNEPFGDPETTIDERIKVAQYLLLGTEDTLKKRMAQLTAMHEQLAEHERSETGDTAL